MSAEKTYEMNWDCEYCGHVRLLGKTHRHCPSCGAPQNPEKRYFPPDNEKVAVEDHQFVGADLMCPHCGTAQSAAAKCCGSCGGPLGEALAAARQTDRVVGPDGVVQQQPGAPMGAQPAPAPKSSSKSGLIIGLVVGGLLVLVVGFFVVRAMWTEQAGLTVASHSWKREIDIERFEAAKDKGACSSMPKKANELTRTKGEKTCKTRKVDQGDGTFKEKEECKTPPDQCAWSVKKWNRARTAKESGTGVDSKPSWPVVRLKRAGNCEGCEREGEHKESYIVHFSDDKSNKELTCSYSTPAKWKRFAKGDKYSGEIRLVGGDLDCGSLEAIK
jgi:hypothetical protein